MADVSDLADVVPRSVPVVSPAAPAWAHVNRTVYALLSDEGLFLARGGKWTRELREAELRPRVHAWHALRRRHGGTIWRVVLVLHSPAIGQVGPEGPGQ